MTSLATGSMRSVGEMGGKGSGGARYRKDGKKRVTPVTQAQDPSNVDRGTNSRVMAFGRDLMDFEPPDLGDAEAVRQRFFDYIELCDRHGLRPMVTSMATAFGIRRQDLWGIAAGDPKYDNWKGGILTPKSRVVLQKAYAFLNAAWETYLVEEKGNPVKWLFLGKNYFGMKDQTEQVQVRMDLTPQLPDPEDVAAKYAAMVGKPQPALTEAEVVDVEDA